MQDPAAMPCRSVSTLPLLLGCGLCFAPQSSTAQPCSRQALDYFEASRRARNILTDLGRSEAAYEDALALYEQALPSAPGYLGAGVVVSTSTLDAVPACIRGGESTMALNRTRVGGRLRWEAADQRMLLQFTYQSSRQRLTQTGGRWAPDPDESVRPFLDADDDYAADQQQYFGARLRLPSVDLTVGVLHVARIESLDPRARALGGPSPGVRGYTRIRVPALYNTSAELVLGAGLDTPESLVLQAPLELPWDFTGVGQVSWLGDERRAVLRAGVTDPTGVVSADLGVETSSAVFRHGRIKARWISDPLIRFPRLLYKPSKDDKAVTRFADRFLNFYLRLGVAGEISRFSGRHFEEVTGQTGVNGWRLQGIFVAHQLIAPVRMQAQVGGGRNRVDLLEHAAAFADREEFLMDLAVTVGW